MKLETKKRGHGRKPKIRPMELRITRSGKKHKLDLRN
jgi:hypothetical protein